MVLKPLIIVLIVVIVVFGPSRLPQLGKSLGKTMRSMREGMDDDSAKDDGDKA